MGEEQGQRQNKQKKALITKFINGWIQTTQIKNLTEIWTQTQPDSL